MTSEQPPQNRAGSTARVIVPIVLATFAGGVILAVSYFANLRRDKQLPVGQRDLAVLIRAVDFEECWEGRVIRTDGETIEKLRDADGGVHLTYHYKHEDGQAFELSCELHVLADRNAARGLFHERMEDRLHVPTTGFEPTETKAFQWGDASTCGQFMRGEQIVGFYFIGRHHERVFRAEISGSFINSEEKFLETLLPHVDKLDGYTP